MDNRVKFYSWLIGLLDSAHLTFEEIADDRIDGCPAGSQSHGMGCQENILGNCRQILYPEFRALSLCHTGGISADKDEERCLLDILCMILTCSVL